MAKDLRQFLQLAREAGAEFYVEAKKPLDPMYEVGVLQHRLAKEGRFPVVYCPEIKGSKLPLVANLFGSYELLGLALDIGPEKLNKAGKDAIVNEYRRRRDKFTPTKEVPPTEAPVREVVLRGGDADLSILPTSLHAELNPGRYVTIGMTLCKDPDTGIPNIGIYRQEVKGKHKLACMMVPAHQGDHIARRCAELGRPMEVVTFIGHHPAVAIAAADDSPPETNEFELMGALLGEPLEVTQALTVDLPVPARAEIAVEGVIDPTQMDSDGPFSEGAGYYGDGRPCYIIRVTAITMRKDAIYHDLHPTHQEHNLVLILGREARIYDRVSDAVSSVKAVHIGPNGYCGQLLIYVAIEKRSNDESRRAGLAALEADAFSKVVVVVDEDVDVYDEREVLWALATRFREEFATSGEIGGTTVVSVGSTKKKVVLDATKPLDEPFPTRVVPPRSLWQSIRLKDCLK